MVGLIAAKSASPLQLTKTRRVASFDYEPNTQLVPGTDETTRALFFQPDDNRTGDYSCGRLKKIAISGRVYL